MAIGAGWVDGAWVDAGWITEAWSDVVAVAADVDKGKDAGSGRRKQWWEGEWIIPGVTHYLPEKPPEDIVPLRPKVEVLKKRLAKSPQAAPEIKSQLTALTRSVTLLERRAQAVVDDARMEQAVRDITKRYRALLGNFQEAETRLAAHEAKVAHLERIALDDDEFMTVLDKVLN